MRVLMLNYEYPPVGGGTANANRYLLQKLDEEDVEVDLVTSSPGEYNEQKLSENITIYKLEVGKEDLSYWTMTEILLYMLKGTLKARKLNMEEEYDLVHAWTGFPCGLMARFLDEDYIVALRGSDVPGYSSRFSRIYPILKPLIRSIWKKSDMVIPNSQDLKELARETLDADMKVIGNGVDTKKFTPCFEVEEKVKVLTVARLVERKRVQDIIRAVDNLEVELELVGDGPEMEDLRELVDRLNVSQNVEFLGQVDHEELPELYSDSDIFVLPSLKEGMSNTILEAMASGLPIITTDTGGNQDLVEGNGFIVPKKDPDSIENALEVYCKQRNKIEVHGKLSRKKAEEMSWESSAEKYHEVYKNLS